MKLIYRTLLLGLITFVPYDVYQLLGLVLLAFILTIFQNKWFITCVWYVLALRWDMTGLTGVLLLTATVVALGSEVWLLLATKIYWRINLLCCR